jgi:glutathione peroxidase
MNLYDFEVQDLSGNTVSLKDYEDYVVLIVNTATKCGFAPQFRGLELLYQTYKDKKFVVLGFPCNQFMHQEPLEKEAIQETCQANYGVTFPLFDKIHVKGKNIHPLYAWLTEETKGFLNSKIKWNFTKFLINRKGNIVERYAPKEEPESFQFDIEEIL